MALLELEGVGKGYGEGATRTEVLSDVNLTVEEGEFVAIVGYSGAGKTTLLSIGAGLLAPDVGVVRMDGKAVSGPGPDRGVVFQNYSLLPWLSAYDNVHLAVDQVFPSWTAQQKREHTQRFLDLVRLRDAGHKRPHELSGGMRQRVSVARALAMKPRVLLLDEPLGALDALTRAALQDEIARIWRESRTTVLLITNDVDEGILLADRIVPLGAGPKATLGPSVSVAIPRPRQRRSLQQSQAFKALRNQVIGWLLGHGRRSPRPVAEAAA
jgi:nitrate/nitrite transport system ATP-binding protein